MNFIFLKHRVSMTNFRHGLCAFNLSSVLFFQREPTWMARHSLIVLMCRLESTHSRTVVHKWLVGCVREGIFRCQCL